ncbi:MAG TPA: hypothetical protein VFV54_09265, partial [Thermoanaerobaculia bacterium]|nr:hypothetical protein [Thermoanaerobaculia bacterium]
MIYSEVRIQRFVVPAPPARGWTRGSTVIARQFRGEGAIARGARRSRESEPFFVFAAGATSSPLFFDAA